MTDRATIKTMSMRSRLSVRLSHIALVLFAAFAFFNSDAVAHSYQQGDIAIGHIWARATAAGATTAAVYVPLKNNGTEPDKLIGASTALADQVTIHEMLMNNGVMKMVEHDSIVLDPGKIVSLQPGGLHLMVTGLKQQIKQGDMFPLTLRFEKAGSINVEVKIEAINAMEPMPSGMSH